MVSANYYKTMKTFERIGIDVESDSSIARYKDFVSTTVAKRNDIIHHNDEASDLSLGDILRTIQTFKEYSKCIFERVRACPHVVASVGSPRP